MKTAILFFALTAVADVETTQSCLARETCREANPLMPDSRWGAYGIKAGTGVGLALLSKKLGNNYALWVSGTSQGVLAVLNLRF